MNKSCKYIYRGLYYIFFFHLGENIDVFYYIMKKRGGKYIENVFILVKLSELNSECR